ncbi:hypothetical protein BG011_000771 [Mortierella polycephala]|uniref:glutathione transferase n=1 Tax=Mortierella polycephala TaxID=41804 RepID=A0A9P6U6I7_9FUNG|nr:hypothetical protein BG011_000771 [Mortierella polycephala]
MAATVSTLPVLSSADSNVLSKVVTSTDSSFKYLYFGLHGRGELTRTLFVFGGAKWEELTIDWPAQKELTPFQCVPVAYETAKDGTVIELAESAAIERYLARKFHLLGKNEYEQVKVDQYVSSTDSVATIFSTKIVFNSPEERVEEANKFYAGALSRFITLHEEHLKKNGSNGHYVGSDFTFADLKTAQLIGRLHLLKPKGADEVPLSAEKTPNLWKVYETVNSQPNLAAWRKSQRYQELDAGSKVFLKF